MRSHPIGAVCKRLLDVAGALLCLAVLWPLMAVVAVTIRMTMGRPILFCQMRPGLNGRPFTLFKFRTMVEGPPSEADPFTDAARLTHIGRALRRLSLDELPQLWNVLKGEMSLVGPRPLLMEYLNYYTAEQAKRHHMKPGITGLAQVKGRNAITWKEKFEWDVSYVNHWNFWLDLHILMSTVVNVFRREGISQQGHATVEKFGAERR
ncbi:sugar transferase [Alloacidobacterium sp.]|uniref:sugar transferase n=1 Tax=Alloacidobacterium sp. TaxID=2951999 RepID=UPI002D56AF19|nr:sugar transferase [Alloacidobacterium sp.]HYK37833.1 sugar transferase [Alloacidobacterium sp.]